MLTPVANDDERAFSTLLVATRGIRCSEVLSPVAFHSIQGRQYRVLDEVVRQSAICAVMQFKHPDRGCGYV